MFFNFFSNFKFAPTYAELEAKLERYADIILELEDLLEDSYDEEVALIEETENLGDILMDYVDELETKIVQVALMKNYIKKLEEENQELKAKVNFIKGVVCN